MEVEEEVALMEVKVEMVAVPTGGLSSLSAEVLPPSSQRTLIKPTTSY